MQLAGKRTIACGALCLCLLQACASAPSSPQPAADAQKREAERAFLKCAIAHESEADDGGPDTDAIALALTNRCAAEYTAVTDIWFRGSPDPDLIRQWKQQRSAERNKIQASLNIVQSIRLGEKPDPNF